MTKITVLIIVLTITNVAYQYFSGGNDYASAFDRSYFQAAAVICSYFVFKS